MGVNASLVDSDLFAIPGQELVCPIQIRNTGPVVDQFTAEVLGAAAGWAVLDPPAVNLFPGEGAEILVRFQPPRASDVPAGPVPFGVRVASREDPRGSWVEEGTVHVAPFGDLRTELVPGVSRGRRRGKHRLEVENLGNTPVETEVLLADPDNHFRFKLSRPAFTAAPGSLTTVKIVAAPRKRFMRGPKQTKKFQALVLPQEGEQVSVEGAFEQRALLPAWLLPALAILLVLAIAAVTLWMTVLRPAVKSAAREAAAEQNAALAANAQDAKQQAQRAEDKADQAAAAATNPSASPGSGAGAGAGSGGANPNDPAALNQPFDLRIQADAAPRTDNGFNEFTSPGQKDKPMDVSDLQLQNPAGDVGIIEIRRNGKVWLRFGMENFRDYDDHFVVPIHFNKGDLLTFAVSCKNPGSKHCSPAVTISGRTTRS